ncbi:hypothetical protein F3Y22_tig00111132pilonHSYRG00015 [Hibiscus syriacus]|uniref:Uncharacterized protein n=1 Tax=Hibiscus syriacus TaxID=106335 RepID=A0A6A2YYD5_HIBSY|nr:hypothetical protein F3Y22_tig00111132pilonHSYRG00015 [Hibiscus syriacus]
MTLRTGLLITELETWLAENLDKSKHSEEYIARFAATLWKLWTYRCVRTFDQNGVVSDEIAMWRSIVVATKLNIDGVSQGNPGLAGTGGMLVANGFWDFQRLSGSARMADELQAVRMV